MTLPARPPGHRRPAALGMALFASGALLCGCGGGDGPAIDAAPQTLQWGATPTLMRGGAATVSATASSGLAVRYVSQTRDICTVVADTGVVSAVAAGDCVIQARQDGDRHYAPVSSTLTLTVQDSRTQTVRYTSVPALVQYGSATVVAVASSGLSVGYASSTPAICTVDASSGLVTALTPGDCTLVATQAGDADHDAASASATITVTASTTTTVPGVPEGVSASLGPTDDTVIVRATGLASSGGSAVTAWVATSVPAGLTATASNSTATVTVSCGGSCAGYAFTLAARNAVGTGTASSAADVVTAFNVRARFHEPDTQPNDTIFTGSFTLNSTRGSISGLAGTLTESMTGSADGSTAMVKVTLGHQLVSSSDGNGGLLVGTFALATVNTFHPGGYADTSNGLYYGWPSAWSAASANSFVLLNLDPVWPTRSLDQAGASRLSYGDCAEGGMMGSACMTGMAGGGTMGGYPVEQVVTRQAD